MARNTSQAGLRIRGERGDPVVRAALVRFASWLREHYEFPTRVTVYLSPRLRVQAGDGEDGIAFFWTPFDPSADPFIRMATGDYKSIRARSGRDDALAEFIRSLSRMLVHYWQWVDTGKTWTKGVQGQSMAMLHEYSEQVSRP